MKTTKLSTTLFAVVCTFMVTAFVSNHLNAQWLQRVAVGPSGAWMDGGDAKSSVGWGGSALAVLTPNIAIQGDVHWFTDLDGDAVSLDATPLCFTLQYRKPSEGISYFAGVGVGYYMFDASVDLDKAFGTELAGILTDRGFRADAEVDDEFGFHVEIGTEISLMEHFTFQVAARYIWVETDINVKSDALAITSPQGQAIIFIDDETIDLSGAGMFLSLRYSF